VFHINVWLTVNDPANAARVGDLLDQCRRMSLQEPGCERYEVFQSEADPAKYLLVETWTSREHWETHRGAEAARTVYLPQVIPLVTREAHICRRIGS
jgi:quinol monooxygenase YgiN